MTLATINIKDLPSGGKVRPNDFFPAARSDNKTYKVAEYSNDQVLFAGEPLTQGDAIYLNSDGFVYKARANNLDSSYIIGLATQSVLQNQEVFFTNFGQVHVTQLLVVGAKYWLSDTGAGSYVSTPPTTSGSYKLFIGIALSQNVLLLQISIPQIIT